MKDYEFGTKYYWCLALILPFVLACCLAIGQRSLADCLSVFNTFCFPPFATLCDNMFATIGWTVPETATKALSYMMLVFIVHLCMDLLTFLPTMCYKVFGIERYEK